MTIPAGTYVFASPSGGDSVEQAKTYCRNNGLTMQDAVLKDEDGEVVVILKRDWVTEE